MNLQSVNISQSAVETLSPNEVESLRRILGCQGNISASVKTDRAYEDTLAAIRARWSAFSISALQVLHDAVFADAEVQRIFDVFKRTVATYVAGRLSTAELPLLAALPVMHSNGEIRSFAEAEQMTNIQEFDVHDCPNLSGEFDFSQHLRLKRIDTAGTRIAKTTVRDNSVLESVAYSPDITEIVLRSQSSLSSVSAVGCKSVQTLEVTGCPNIDQLALLRSVIASPLSSVTLLGVDGTEIDNAADIIYSLIAKNGTRNLQGRVACDVIYNFLPDLINASDDVACITGGSSSKPFVVTYNSTKAPDLDQMGLTMDDPVATYYEGTFPQSIVSTVSANEEVFRIVKWTSDLTTVDQNGVIPVPNYLQENESRIEKYYIYAQSKFNSAAKVSRDITVVRIAASGIKLSLDGGGASDKGSSVVVTAAWLNSNCTKNLDEITLHSADPSNVITKLSAARWQVVVNSPSDVVAEYAGISATLRLGIVSGLAFDNGSGILFDSGAAVLM